MRPRLLGWPARQPSTMQLAGVASGCGKDWCCRQALLLTSVDREGLDLRSLGRSHRCCARRSETSSDASTRQSSATSIRSDPTLLGHACPATGERQQGIPQERRAASYVVDSSRRASAPVLLVLRTTKGWLEEYWNAGL